MDGPALVTFVCRNCHSSFQQEKPEQRSFLVRLFGGGSVSCPKCGSTQVSDADNAPLTTRQFRKKKS